jgi:hypothetical protein
MNNHYRIEVPAQQARSPFVYLAEVPGQGILFIFPWSMVLWQS